jgi:NADH-quinone oxidoreductase subunit N
MFAGNLGALVQSNVKRMLAYSSIAHAGYVLVAFASVPYLSANTDVGAAQAYAAILFYLVGYALVKIGAFTVVSQLGGKIERHVSMDDYAGLALRHPVAAVSLTLYLLSLLGMPVTAGFFGKFYILKAAISSHLIWLAVIMAVNSVIGAYYYLRLIVIMYMRDPSEEPEEPEVKRFPLSVEVVLGITAFASIYLGLRPQAIINFILQPNLFGH